MACSQWRGSYFVRPLIRETPPSTDKLAGTSVAQVLGGIFIIRCNRLGYRSRNKSLNLRVTSGSGYSAPICVAFLSRQYHPGKHSAKRPPIWS